MAKASFPRRALGAVKAADRVTDRWAATAVRQAPAVASYALRYALWLLRRLVRWHTWTLRHVPAGIGRLLGGLRGGAARVIPDKPTKSTGWLVLIFLALIFLALVFGWSYVSVVVGILFDLIEESLYALTGIIIPDGIRFWATVYAIVMALGWYGTRTTPAPAAMAVVNADEVKLREIIRECVPAIAKRTDPEKGNPDALTVGKLRGDEAGRTVIVTLPVGFEVTDLPRGKIASGWGIPTDRLTITTGQTDRHAVLRFSDLSPAEMPAARWPLENVDRFSLLDPIPIGQDTDGRPVSLSLATKLASGKRLAGGSLLIGGASGSGKTTLVRLLVAAAALDPKATIAIADLKGDSDYEALTPACDWHAHGVSDATLDRLRAMLAQAQRHMADRLAGRAERTPLVIVVDEVQRASGDKAIMASIEDLVRVGRAAGIVVIIATQKPTKDSLPTGIRDNIASGRIALRLGEQAMNDAILGTGAYSSGMDATKIPRSEEGGGFVSVNGFEGRARMTHVADATAARIATEHQREPGVMFTAAVTESGDTGGADIIDLDEHRHLEPETVGNLAVDVIEQPTPVSTPVARIRHAWPAGVKTLHPDELLEVLRAAYPNDYRDLTEAGLADLLPGVAKRPAWSTAKGKTARGYHLADLPKER